MLITGVDAGAYAGAHAIRKGDPDWEQVVHEYLALNCPGKITKANFDGEFVQVEGEWTFRPFFAPVVGINDMTAKAHTSVRVSDGRRTE